MTRAGTIVVAVASALVGAAAAWAIARSNGTTQEEGVRPGGTPAEEAPAPTRAPDPASPSPTATLAPGTAESAEVASLRRTIAELQRRLEARDPANGMADAIQEMKDVLEAQKRLRPKVTELLLTPSKAVQSRYASLLARKDGGAARILPRGVYEDWIEPRGGGAYYSFETRSNSYDKEPDLELEQGKFGSGFYGASWGHLLDLGAIAIETVPESGTPVPAVLSAAEQEDWKDMWEDGATPEERATPQFTHPALNRRLSRNWLPSVVGHSYLLRAFLPGEHDHLVAFSVVEEDEHGQTLVWRVLRTWPLSYDRKK